MPARVERCHSDTATRPASGWRAKTPTMSLSTSTWYVVTTGVGTSRVKGSAK